MSHYEERLEGDLERLRNQIREVSSRVQEALDAAVRSFYTENKELAYETIIRDQIINRAVRKIDQSCHAFVARHLPSAGHLRFISAVLRLSIALERIGDYAVSICRESVRLSQPPSSLRTDLELFVNQTRDTLRQSTDAFIRQNAERAKSTLALSRTASATYDKVFAHLRRKGEEGAIPISDLFSLLVISTRLERTCDQAQNICEQTIFSVTGQSKLPKEHHILFLDEGNTITSRMAEMIARKAFGEAAVYSSAGWNPGKESPAEFVEFMKSRGHDVKGRPPAKFPRDPELLKEFHIIVDLQGRPSEVSDLIPYHIVVLRWQLNSLAPPTELNPASLEQLYRQLLSEIRELIEILRGDELER